MIRPDARPCHHVEASHLNPGGRDAGEHRLDALQVGSMWSGTVDTESGAVSGWHHHGDHDTTLYVVPGRCGSSRDLAGNTSSRPDQVTSCMFRRTRCTESPARARTPRTLWSWGRRLVADVPLVQATAC